jgi:hypothetical protein
MKKIIAAAVATAFVAPAFAADISVGGALTYNYITTNKTLTDDKVAADDTIITVKASEELANGMSVTGTINVVNDGPKDQDVDMQGSNLAISGSFGKLVVGDTSGAADATGDWTDVSPVFGGFDADGIDATVAYTLPTMVEGLQLMLSTSPKGANSTGDGDLDTEGLGGNSYSATYSMGAFSAYVANDTYDAAADQETDRDTYGIKYSAGPVMLVLEQGKAKNASIAANSMVAYTTAISDKSIKYSAMAGTYAIGDTKVGFETQKIEEDDTSTTRQDETTVFVTHSLGGGVSVYAATTEDKGGADDTAISQQAVGVKFAF